MSAAWGHYTRRGIGPQQSAPVFRAVWGTAAGVEVAWRDIELTGDTLVNHAQVIPAQAGQPESLVCLQGMPPFLQGMTRAAVRYVV